MVALGFVGGFLLGQNGKITREIVALNPISRETIPGGGRILLVHRNDSVGKEQILAGPSVCADGGNPDRQSEGGKTANRGAVVASAHENSRGLEIFETGLDTERDEMQRQNLARQ